MIRNATRIALTGVVILSASPFIARAQAPWRQVYKDSDVTVVFDTASVAQQSPGTWTTVTSWDYSRPRLTEQKKQYSRLVERAYVRCSPVRLWVSAAATRAEIASSTARISVNGSSNFSAHSGAPSLTRSNRTVTRTRSPAC